MHENSAIAISNALRAASYAVLKACKMASDAVLATTNAHPLPDDSSARNSILELPTNSRKGIADRQSAAFRAVLETRRAYLLAISLATQVNVPFTTPPRASNRLEYLSGREPARRPARLRVASPAVRTLHLVSDTD